MYPPIRNETCANIEFTRLWQAPPAVKTKEATSKPPAQGVQPPTERASNAQWNCTPSANGTGGNGYQSTQYGNGNFNNRGGWGQQRYTKVTGANDTPLGTPTRRSPVSTSVAAAPAIRGQSKVQTPVAEPKANGPDHQEKSKKRKSMGDQDMVHLPILAFKSCILMECLFCRCTVRKSRQIKRRKKPKILQKHCRRLYLHFQFLLPLS